MAKGRCGAQHANKHQPIMACWHSWQAACVAQQTGSRWQRGSAAVGLLLTAACGVTTAVLDDRCSHVAADSNGNCILHDQQVGHTSSSQGAPKDTPLSI